MRKNVGKKRGFGTVQCSRCARMIQGDVRYFQIVERIKTQFRLRRAVVIRSLCADCFCGLDLSPRAG